MRNPSKKLYFLRLLGSLLSLSLLILLLEKQGWKDILSAISKIPTWCFWTSLILMLFSRFSVTLRWHVLLYSAGLKIPLRDTLRLTFSGLFASNFLPSTIGGDMFRLAGAIQLKFDAAICAASLVVDRLVGMAGMALLLPLGIPGFLELRNTIFSRSQIPILLVNSFFLKRNWIIRIYREISQFTFDTLKTLQYWIKNPASLFYALLLSGLHMLCLVISISILLSGLNEGIHLWLIAGLWSLVYFVTLIPISINGYGLQEIAFTIIFVHGGGISTHNSVTIALLIRVIIMVTSLPGALFLPGIISGQKVNMSE